MRIKYEDEAKLDLLGIGDYYRKIGGSQLANRMIKEIRREVNVLTNYTAPPYEFVPGMHRLVVAKGAFLVFHRVLDTVVEVVHVRRSERTPATEKDME